MEYYSVIKKIKNREILPFVTTQMKFEGIMLREKSQRKTNTVWSHLYMESKKNKAKTNSEREIRLVVTKGGRRGEGEMKKSD